MFIFYVGVLGRLVVCLVERQWPAHISLIAGHRQEQEQEESGLGFHSHRSGSGMQPRACSALITGQSITHHHHRGRTKTAFACEHSIQAGGPGTQMDHVANIIYKCITFNSKFSALVGFIKGHVACPSIKPTGYLQRMQLEEYQRI